MWSKTTESLLISLFVICFHDLGKSPAALTIDHSRHNYTTVPQNLTKTVTKLVLAFNNISRIDNTSFANYKDLQHINFENNSLKYILEGSFDNNPHLKTLIFKHCELRRLPPSFGPSTPFMENLDFGDAIEPDATGTIRNQYLAPFTSLVYLRLTGVDLFTLEDIFLPRSLQTLSVAYCRLSVFPNVSADRLPALERLFIYGNPLQAIPDDMFAGISDSIIQFVAASADLSVAPNLALKKRLSSVILKGNNLETLNDLLEELPLLDEILLEKNGRWTCDKRMCWWRLWERVRTEITFDNPQCVNPASLGNFTLRDVNPKFMDCFNDSRFRDLFQGRYYDLARKGSHTTIKTGSFQKDFNYDRVLEQAIHSSSSVRSRLECVGLCLSNPHCHGVIFNVTELPDEDNCVLLRQTNCGLEVCP